MVNRLLLNTIALEPNRWRRDREPVFNLIALLPAIAESGFRFVEVWEGHVSRLGGRTVQDVRALADALGLKLPITGLYPQLHLGGAQGAVELARIQSLMTSARKLGSEVIKFFVGSVPTESISQAELDASIGCLRSLSHHADTLGLTLAGEFHANTLFDSVESILNIVHEVPTLKVCFQPFDFSSTEGAIDDLNRLGDNVVHLHLQGRSAGEFSQLEDADIHYADLFEALATMRYTGDLGIEFVVGCISENVDANYLKRILAAAEEDAAFVRTSGAAAGLTVEG